MSAPCGLHSHSVFTTIGHIPYLYLIIALWASTRGWIVTTMPNTVGGDVPFQAFRRSPVSPQREQLANEWQVRHSCFPTDISSLGVNDTLSTGSVVAARQIAANVATVLDGCDSFRKGGRKLLPIGPAKTMVGSTKRCDNQCHPRSFPKDHNRSSQSRRSANE